MSLRKSFFNNLGSKSVYFKVHLNSRDTLLRTGNLAVHVAVEVFKSLNINHCHKVAVNALVACDKTAGNTRNGSFNRNTRRHKSEG